MIYSPKSSLEYYASRMANGRDVMAIEGAMPVEDSEYRCPPKQKILEINPTGIGINGTYANNQLVKVEDLHQVLMYPINFTGSTAYFDYPGEEIRTPLIHLSLSLVRNTTTIKSLTEMYSGSPVTRFSPHSLNDNTILVSGSISDDHGKLRIYPGEPGFRFLRRSDGTEVPISRGYVVGHRGPGDGVTSYETHIDSNIEFELEDKNGQGRNFFSPEKENNISISIYYKALE